MRTVASLVAGALVASVLACSLPGSPRLPSDPPDAAGTGAPSTEPTQVGPAPDASQTAASPTAAAGVASLTDFSEALDPATEPVRVNLVTDSAMAVSVEVPVEGGTLTTTGRDGTRFTLTIPGGALVVPTTITMTPIETMQGLPVSGGLAAAVEFKPDGLVLYEVATLDIELADPVRLDQQIPVGVSGAEHNLTLEFADISDGSLRLQLFHFSSAGVAKGLLADLEPVRQRLGGAVEARLRSMAAYVLANLQQQQLLGVEDAIIPPEFLEAYIRTYREEVLNPRLEAAPQSCAAGRLALLTYFEMQQELQLLGSPLADEGLSQQIKDLLPIIVRQCMQEEYELCRDEHIVHHILVAIRQIERQLALFGLDAALSAEIEEAYALVARCLKFELKFESTVSGDTPAVKGGVSLMSSTVMLAYDRSKNEISGDGQLVNSSFTIDEVPVTGGNCKVEGFTGPDGTLKVTAMRFHVEYRDVEDQLGYVEDLTLAYKVPAFSHDGVQGKCTVGPQTVNINNELSFWTMGFLPAHKSEMAGKTSQFGGNFLAQRWTVKGQDLFAELSWTVTANTDLQDKGFFQLYHRPE